MITDDDKRIAENKNLPRYFDPGKTIKLPDPGNQTGGLFDLLSELPEKLGLVVEVGSFAGVSTEAFALMVKHVISVDSYVDDHGRKGLDLFRMRTKMYDNISTLRMDSRQAASLFADHSIDLVYIDAAHDHASVMADIAAWRGKVKKGGWLAGHDYYNGGDGHDTCQVKDVVNQVFGKPDKTFSDTSWIVQL